MTPLSWRTAGWVLLGIAAVLVLIALFAALRPPVAYPMNLRAGSTLMFPGESAGGLRGLVPGAFAGVAFFLGLACFAAAAAGEARRQRADILLELAALRQRLDREPGEGKADPAAEG